MQLNIDAEFQNLIPPLSDEEFRQLEENVKSEGCRDALVIWQGTIVDGHNRYKICQENALAFKTEEKEFASREEVIEWIIKNQFGRRNLSSAQRCELALRLKPMIQERAKENQRKAEGGDRKSSSRKNQGSTNLTNLDRTDSFTVPTKLSKAVDTRKELADIAGVSQGTLSKVENILNMGTQEQIERARKGGKGNSVDVIYREVTGKEKPEKKHPEEIPDLESEKSLFQEEGDEAPVKDELEKPEPEKIDFYKLSRKEQRQIQQSAVEALKNPNLVRKLSVEALVGMIEANLSTALKTLESMLKEHSDLVMDEENNPKIIAVLSEAGAAIEKMKGNYSYE